MSGNTGSEVQMAALDAGRLPFNDIPGGRNSENTGFQSANTISGVAKYQSELGVYPDAAREQRGLAGAQSVKTYPSGVSEKSKSERAAAQSDGRSKSRGAKSGRSKQAEKKAKEDLVQQREFKKYAVSLTVARSDLIRKLTFSLFFTEEQKKARNCGKIPQLAGDTWKVLRAASEIRRESWRHLAPKR